ncbi:HET-domain-containing protein [Dothidotthia symphoricarpi CBS 119687]|uniref:HET-domain-containing protein n=1 Tax=Dothidotthia symphoricarpi CBS 119687 TaxID=1392245 RepID=A0A6A6A9R7_9PLEO|nr:HET-domain-containing protein [Dothidotthia symphoricarpi CBS 119687]KAF2127587.1 HET-domain-containing protein [Dothidotthia symphoricarpi CBS 119687]
MLCKFCTELDFESPCSLSTDVDILLESANKGCEGCNVFLDAYKRFFENWSQHNNISPPLNALDFLAKVPLHTPVEVVQQSSCYVHISLPEPLIQYNPNMPPVTLLSRLCSVSGAESTRSITADGRSVKFPLSRIISPNSGDEACFNSAQEWFKQCIHQHGGSCTLPVDAALPSRLIHIPTASSELLRLCNTKDKRGQYVALSYCWGKGNTFHTTMSTLQDRLIGFSIDSLPKTLRDAVYIARRMGFEWIWVDALCILQGDIEDWNRESALMASVYGNAAFTISADLATDTDHGILGPRDILLSHRFGKQHDFCLQFDDTEFGKEIVPRTPLSTRGWAYQERLLSPRILHYFSREIVWECNTGRFSETHVKSDYHWMTGSVLDKAVYARGLNSVPVNCDNSEANARIEIWNQIAEDVAQRDFTVETDKLPGVSSLATAHAIPALGRYIAGTWEYNPFLSMLWSPGKPQPLSNRIHQAPSWSWAWVKGPLHWFKKNVFYLIKVEDEYHEWYTKFKPKLLSWHIVPQGSDPKGRVMEGGYLVMSGWCREVYVAENEEMMFYYSHRHGCVQMDHRGSDFVRKIFFDEDLVNASDSFDKKAAEKYLCVQISEPGWTLYGFCVHALVLQRVDGEEEAFTRVGIHHFHPKGHESGWERRLLKLY